MALNPDFRQDDGGGWSERSSMNRFYREPVHPATNAGRRISDFTSKRRALDHFAKARGVSNEHQPLAKARTVKLPRTRSLSHRGEGETPKAAIGEGKPNKAT